MNFANLFWLLLLIPLGIGFYILVHQKDGNKTALYFPDISILKRWLVADPVSEQILKILRVVGLILIVIALARPQTTSNVKEPPNPVVDIVICLDTSLSMSALDFEPQNRLDAAKKSAEEFIGKRPLDRIGLVVFGGRPIAQCPLTLDHETLIELLRSIPINATGTDGTAIGSAIALSAARLSESEAKTKIIILLTDGRNNTGNIDPVTAAGIAKNLGIKIYSIGSAVPGGGLIPVDDPVFGRRLVKMAEDLDEPTLQEIARLTSAKYFRVTSARRFKEIYDEIDGMEKTKVEIGVTVTYKDYYVPVLLGAMLLLFVEIFLRNVLWRTMPG
ncbi:MAG: VWA domain-containing protein [Elusimicrobia bacterium]|nr:VWA domain-containing protein [Candidatus Obscuribacterium magneticum]